MAAGCFTFNGRLQSPDADPVCWQRQPPFDVDLRVEGLYRALRHAGPRRRVAVQFYEQRIDAVVGLEVIGRVWPETTLADRARMLGTPRVQGRLLSDALTRRAGEDGLQVSTWGGYDQSPRVAQLLPVDEPLRRWQVDCEIQDRLEVDQAYHGLLAHGDTTIGSGHHVFTGQDRREAQVAEVCRLAEADGVAVIVWEPSGDLSQGEPVRWQTRLVLQPTDSPDLYAVAAVRAVAVYAHLRRWGWYTFNTDRSETPTSWRDGMIIKAVGELAGADGLTLDRGVEQHGDPRDSNERTVLRLWLRR